MTKGTSFSKYTMAERAALQERVTALLRAGLGKKSVLDALIREGFRRPGGESPILMRDIYRALRQSGPQGQAGAPQTPPISREAVLGILTDPGLSEAKKIRVLTAYLED